MARVFLLVLVFAAVVAFLPRQSFSQTTPFPLRWNGDGSVPADVVTTSLSGTQTSQDVALKIADVLDGTDEWSVAIVYACRWTSVVISDTSFSVPDTCREIVNKPGSTSEDYTMSYTPNSEEIAHGGVVFLLGIDIFGFSPVYTEWIPFGDPPAEASITGTDPSSLTKGNIDGARVTVTLTNARYVGASSLGTDDFELVSSPSGVSIESVRRTSGTVAVLTLSRAGYDDYEGLYEDGKLSVRVLAAGHTGNESILTVEEIDVTAVVLPETSFSEHPFLIVKESMYPELRKRAEREPWATIKRSAVVWFNRGYSPRSSYWGRCRDLTVYLSRGALVYMLAESETARQSAATAMVNAITQSFPSINSGLTAGNHGKTVVPGQAFFIAVLAVDIIYDDMSGSQRTAVDNALQPAANFFINYGPTINWPLNIYGARLVWHLFKNDQAAANTAINKYIEVLNDQVTADGVFREGAQYGAVRMAQANYAKSYAMDVIAFTGKRDLYREPRLISLYEWIYGYSLTPFGTFYSFGDSRPDDLSYAFPHWHTRAHSAGRFSTTAGLNAAYAMRGKTPSIIDLPFLAYIFQEREPLVPRPPPSRIFPDGGAYFLERTESAEALAGAMNNVKDKYQDHMHKDANAIHIAAYGENVLRNSGFVSWGSGTSLINCPTCTWAYINRTARSSNVVTVDEVDYTAKPGGGITEGFTGDSFDYASGRSGPGFSNGVHDRNFCFVHPSDGANGYFVLFDEVFSESGAIADMYLHPNSDDANIKETRERYRWPVGSSTASEVRRTDNDVSVTVFLATPPDTATIEEGVLAGKHSFVGEYLHAKYGIEDKRARFATVIFPHDRRHSRPDMTRIGEADLYTGARIEHSREVEDFVVQPVAGKADETISDIDGKGVSVRGAAAWFRMRGDMVESFFLRDGKLFETGGLRLETGDSVSMLLEGTRGRIIAGEGGTDLTVGWRGGTDFDIHLNGRPQRVVDAGNNRIKVRVPAGNHQFGIVARTERQGARAAAPQSARSVPRLVSGALSASDRKVIMLTYSVALDEESRPAAGAFSVRYQAAGGTEEISVDDVSVEGRVVRLTLVSAIPVGASGLNVFYRAEEGGDAAVRSMAGIEALDGSVVVTEDSPVAVAAAPGGGCALSFSGSGAVGVETLLALALLVLGGVSRRAKGKRN